MLARAVAAEREGLQAPLPTAGPTNVVNFSAKTSATFRPRDRAVPRVPIWTALIRRYAAVFAGAALLAALFCAHIRGWRGRHLHLGVPWSLGQVRGNQQLLSSVDVRGILRHLARIVKEDYNVSPVPPAPAVFIPVRPQPTWLHRGNRRNLFGACGLHHCISRDFAGARSQRQTNVRHLQQYLPASTCVRPHFSSVPWSIEPARAPGGPP